MNYTGNPCADFVLDRLFVVAVVVMALVSSEPNASARSTDAADVVSGSGSAR